MALFDVEIGYFLIAFILILAGCLLIKFYFPHRFRNYFSGSTTSRNRRPKQNREDKKPIMNGEDSGTPHAHDYVVGDTHKSASLSLCGHRLFISLLESDSFVFFSSRFICAAHMSRA